MRARIADIIHHAAALSGFTPEQIRGKRRTLFLVRVRQAVCLIAKEQTRRDGDLILKAYSYPQIGMALGGRDHSTVIHGVEQAEENCRRDVKYAEFVERLRDAVRSGEIFAEMAPVMVGEQRTRAVPQPRPKPMPVPKPKPLELERYTDGGNAFILDENGDCPARRSQVASMVKGSAAFAQALMQAPRAA